MIILKVGGGKEINWDYIASDLKNLKDQVVIVHGANYLMKDISAKLGVTEKIITSPSGHTSRYTDEKTMEILLMTYSGLMNKKIVATLRKYGINAVGLCGADGGIWLGKKKETILSRENGKVKVIRDSRTGNVESVNANLIKLLIDKGYTPVLTIPAITQNGELINVDNDRAVAVMVKELKVEKIVMLFEAPGLLKDPSDEASRFKEIKKEEIDTYLEMANGRMRKKLLGIKEAFTFGVQEVYLGDGRIKHPILNTLEGKGTIIH
ncbi:acetylglutamate kinase [Candidatus Gottesmanbacteria bacterium RIFCSPLOWO2_01_FULL_39_12b]|uniref:Acetylglutamate kinase n=1 Tax=Candidatus Gottesmanbacteria bacterium RIFCSPLOWO2_01_FULL_39_12b TaxID=1798388 RepID=A0A1F6ARG2_9BACT|nr:MAG: acetylglutamate kinase [Candidatus Gottesmanbacteria bacterium RIFCSPLOWO2_01_FULL_39_12b]